MEHIGKKIRQELHLQQRTVTWFARQLHCDRTNVYNIFSRTNIDVQLLIRISQILRRNFFSEINEEIDTILVNKRGVPTSKN